MKLLFLLALIPVVAAQADEPTIRFDNRPEAGIPMEARRQEKDLPAAVDLPANATSLPTLHTLTDGNIKSVRIRYYNKDVWTTEEQAQAYVRSYLAAKTTELYGFQVWSQSVGIPEIECFIEYTDEYRSKRREQNKPCESGRLLLWNTESCFRDASGRWWYVSAFDHFHKHHPKGNREFAKHDPGEIPKAPPEPSAKPIASLPTGSWNIVFTNGVNERCEIRLDGTATVKEPLRSAAGTVKAIGSSYQIDFADSRVERWTRIGRRFVVEHWASSPKDERSSAPVLGIAEQE